MPLWYPSATFSPARVTGFVGRNQIHVWPGAGIATTYMSDTFTRADSAVTLGSPDVGNAWVTSGTWGISTNQAYNVAGSYLPATSDSTAADCTVYAEVFIAGGGDSGVVFRYLDDNDFWLVQVKDTVAITLYENNSGTYTSRGTGSTTAGGGNTYAITVVLSGTSITVKVAGSTEITYSSSLHQSNTKHGMVSAEITTRWDNFLVTT